MKDVRRLIVLVGPTGVGKTELSLRLAQYFNSPIISADSRQIYRDIPIGTAAPTKEELALVPHYFVGTHSLAETYNAGQYERDCLQTLECLWPKHPTLLLTGGSMMYIDAVCNGLDTIPNVPESIRSHIKTRYAERGLEWLQREVERLDPNYWSIVDKTNPQRLMHGLEVTIATGKTYSSFRKRDVKKRTFEIIKIGLFLPREKLYERINQRVDNMLEQGLEEEARRAYPYKRYNSLQTVGFREFFAYFDGTITREEAIRLIKQNSRHYAKRQMTWFRADPTIHWLQADTDYDKKMDIIIGWLRADGLQS